MTTDVTLKKVRLSVSNAVHSLAVLVAHDEGLFRDQGLDVESCGRQGQPMSTRTVKPCGTPSSSAPRNHVQHWRDGPVPSV